MKYEVKYGDTVVPVIESESNEVKGLKLVNKCELLDNLEIYDIKKTVDNYKVMELKQYFEQAESAKLVEEHNEPQEEIGEKFEFRGKLFGKNVKLVLRQDVKLNGWVEALNKILDALYYYNADIMEEPVYADLPEFYSEEKDLSDLNCVYVTKFCEKYGVEKCIAELKKYASDVTVETIDKLKEQYENRITIKDYMESVECDEEQYVEIFVDGNVVCSPEVYFLETDAFDMLEETEDAFSLSELFDNTLDDEEEFEDFEDFDDLKELDDFGDEDYFEDDEDDFGDEDYFEDDEDDDIDF